MSAATEALAFAAAIAIADDTGELDEVLSEMLADPDVDWATISIKLARICAALVQSSLEDEGVYDGVARRAVALRPVRGTASRLVRGSGG